MGPECSALFVRWFKRLSLKAILPRQTSPRTLTATRRVHQKIDSQAAMPGNLSSNTLFAYTAGRWLHQDKPQRDARYIEFNFDRLCEKVLSLCPSATSIESCQKLEGGFSRAFIITTDNGRRVVAKFPTSVPGPARYVTNSEVATITYLRRHTKVPIPAILDWCDDPANPIGSAYIIMEHAGGVQLQEIWTELPSDMKVKSIGAICSSIRPISEIDFPAYGSLYFADAAFLDADSKQRLNTDLQFCIGPHCRSTYWDCNVGEPRYYAFKKPNRGPWRDLSSYASALIDVGFARLPPADHPVLRQRQTSYQGSLDKHLELLKVGQALFPKLIQHTEIQSNAAPTLFHPDLHKRNIFVSKGDPTTVTGFIDWQCASVEPSFYYADDVPDFAKVPSEGTSENAEASLCSQAYELGWALLAPRLGAARKIDESLLRQFRYCHRTWRDGFVPFTYELMRLRDRWKELGFNEDDCPIPALSVEDMSFYKEQLGDYDKMLDFKQDMIETLGVEEDGWVPEDRWEGARQAHRYFYGNIMASMENDNDREELKTIWPFDDCQEGQ